MSKSGTHWKHKQSKRRKNRERKQVGNSFRINEQWNEPTQKKDHKKAA
jgi:hypothetical protein